MSWELFVVKGDKAIVRGFVHGFVWGAGDPRGVFCEAELPLERESLARFLKLGPHQRLLVRGALAGQLAQAIENAHEELELKLVERRRVQKLSFEAQARVFSQEQAAEIRQLFFETIPSSVAVADVKEEETRDVSAKGAELYAPVHHYEYRASCTFSGPPEDILALHHKLFGRDFIEVGDIHVE